MLLSVWEPMINLPVLASKLFVWALYYKRLHAFVEKWSAHFISKQCGLLLLLHRRSCCVLYNSYIYLIWFVSSYLFLYIFFVFCTLPTWDVNSIELVLPYCFPLACLFPIIRITLLMALWSLNYLLLFSLYLFLQEPTKW